MVRGEGGEARETGGVFFCLTPSIGARDGNHSRPRAHVSPPQTLLHTAALKAVIEECKPGAKLVDVCAKGDAVIEE